MQNYKGTLDYNANEWKKIKLIIDTIRKYVEFLDIQEIDTPIIEYNMLLDKNENKNNQEQDGIFNLKNTNASLRFDLTVPLKRYMLTNGIDHIRRFQIGKVFRRESPYPESGRFCEFYQADVDIVGDYPEMESEVEIFWLIDHVLQSLGLPNYKIKYNYYQNLVKICNNMGVTDPKRIKNICITIDKLDKKDWNEIEIELHNIRRLSSNQIDILRTALKTNYLDKDLIERNNTLGRLVNNKKLVFDATLARGLDYYTGIIYEVVLYNKIKTIVAGGRYNKLLYKRTKNGKKYIPAIGVSFGVSRINCVVAEYNPCKQKLFLICEDYDMRIKLSCLFRDKCFIVSVNNYKKNNKKIISLITYAVKNSYDYVVIYGEDNDLIRLKILFNNSKDNLFSYDKIKSMESTEIFN